MINDSISSLLSNFRQKTTNPFLGTLIIVWGIQNWELIYSLFVFDINYTRIEKVEYITTYFTKKGFYGNLLICIGESIIVLVATYFLLNLSRYIINIFENRITPQVYKWSNPKSIVTIEVFSNLEKEKDNWIVSYEKERNERLRLQIELDRLEKKKELQVEGIQENEKFIEPLAENNKTIYLIYKDIQRKFTNEFDDVISQISFKKSLNNEEPIVKYLNTFGIIEMTDRDYNNYSYFMFTPKGELLKELYLNESIAS